MRGVVQCGLAGLVAGQAVTLAHGLLWQSYIAAFIAGFVTRLLSEKAASGASQGRSAAR